MHAYLSRFSIPVLRNSDDKIEIIIINLIRARGQRGKLLISYLSVF